MWKASSSDQRVLDVGCSVLAEISSYDQTAWHSYSHMVQFVGPT